jgi:hypothetical protein
MTGLLDKLRSWWNKDEREVAEEETRMTERERELTTRRGVRGAQARRAGPRGQYLDPADFEADSEAPRR